MKLSINRILPLLATALAVTATSQAALQAHFHLPVAAHWGPALLAPGDYNLAVLDSNSGPRNVVIRGEGRTAYAMSVIVEPLDSDTHSSLRLVKQGKDYFVREYRSGTIGKTYTFPVPKARTSAKLALEIRD
jgi:hypothetical protein